MKKRKITNWSEYNTFLCQRGSITLWFSEEAIQNCRFWDYSTQYL